MKNREISNDPYLEKYRSGFSGVLQWEQLEQLFAKLRLDSSNSWFIYDTEKPPPANADSLEELTRFLDFVYALLRREHKQDYCGVVYVDDIEQPTFIKIYHPKRLGVVCGIGREPVLPAWILSREKPIDLR